MPDSLSVGKLDPKMLRRLVFSTIGKKDSRVLVGPNIGEDAAVIDFGERVLVVHSDPVTGAVENVGRLAVYICTNDIATRGVRPLWLLTVLLLPEDINSAQLEELTAQINEVAIELGVAIVGGHSEVTPGINRPIIVTTALGETSKEKFVRTSGAKVGDFIITTKGAAIEGTAILSHELESSLQRRIGKRTVERAKQFVRRISVVKDALTAIEVGGVHAMHDATEGGIAAGLQEISWASDVGIVAYEEKIPLHKETRLICEALNIDPLKTISSGTLIISAASDQAEKIVATLRKAHIQASIIGEVVDRRKGCYILRSDGTKFDLSKPVKEELWRVLPDLSKR